MFQYEEAAARRRELFSGKNTKEAAEEYLAESFASHVGQLSLREMVVMLEDRKLPRSLGEFSLLPLISLGVLKDGSLSRSGTGYILPDGIKATYSSSRIGHPPLDAGFSIGLVRKDWLVALASAGIDEEDNIQITQLQDVSGASGDNWRRQPDEHYRTGLHDGFLWRDTLVACWIQLALEAGIGNRVIVQGGQNNYWRTSSNKERLTRNYDEVAERLGFTPNEDGNWGAELYAGDLVWPEFSANKTTSSALVDDEDPMIRAINRAIETL
jgi:hypothetical protein